jgi:L-ascorbate metabolism protein UlaG (beta-lactamase superfamily)
MTINWYGQSCFQITSTHNKNHQVNLVIDPFSQETGLKVPCFKADIVLTSHDHYDHNNVKAVVGDPFVVNTPGEYEIKDVFIQGISSFHDSLSGKEKGVNVIYVIEAEQLRVCHLGDLGQKELSPEQLEKIGQVDILMIPVGGTYTISSKEAIKIMSQIEPSVIIPMHYQLPKLKIKLDGVDKFLKAMGIKKIEPMAKLSIKKKDIVPEEAKIIVLNC